MVGVGALAITFSSGGTLACASSMGHSCDDHSDCSVPTENSHEEDSCPHDHHHHLGCCALFQPLMIEKTLICRVDVIQSSLLRMSHESEIAPDEPFLSLEKPPLI